MDETIESNNRGVIKAYFPLREFGFITRPKGSDLFFLRSAFFDEIQIAEGAKVEFDVQASAKGPRAVNIKRIA